MQSLTKKIIIFLLLIILNNNKIISQTHPDTVRWGFYFTSVDETVAKK